MMGLTDTHHLQGTLQKCITISGTTMGANVTGICFLVVFGERSHRDPEAFMSDGAVYFSPTE